jgi:hypothetical protein
MERRSDGIVDSDGQFYPWSYLDVTPNEKIKRPRSQDDTAAKRKARAEALEAERLERLFHLQRAVGFRASPPPK